MLLMRERREWSRSSSCDWRMMLISANDEVSSRWLFAGRRGSRKLCLNAGCRCTRVLCTRVGSSSFGYPAATATARMRVPIEVSIGVGCAALVFTLLLPRCFGSFRGSFRERGGIVFGVCAPFSPHNGFFGRGRVDLIWVDDRLRMGAGMRVLLLLLRRSGKCGVGWRMDGMRSVGIGDKSPVVGCLREVIVMIWVRVLV